MALKCPSGLNAAPVVQISSLHPNPQPLRPFVALWACKRTRGAFLGAGAPPASPEASGHRQGGVCLRNESPLRLPCVCKLGAISNDLTKKSAGILLLRQFLQAPETLKKAGILVECFQKFLRKLDCYLNLFGRHPFITLSLKVSSIVPQ